MRLQASVFFYLRYIAHPVFLKNGSQAPFKTKQPGSEDRANTLKMAEREGFEPSVQLYTAHSLSRRAPSASSAISPNSSTSQMAEGVGFEPTELSLNGFQDRRLKPLGHPS
jgi:hypothetical protein